MASSDEYPSPTPAIGTEAPPGEALTMGQRMLDKGAAMLQSLKPIKQMSQHACTFALYAHDMSRQIQTHHYATRLNRDFLQCAVYDSDDSSARLLGMSIPLFHSFFFFTFDPHPPLSLCNYMDDELIIERMMIILNSFVCVYAGIEYIVSDTVFDALPPDEQKLWHSHAYEVLFC